MADFDIEAYLEEQVTKPKDAAKTDSTEEGSNNNKVDRDRDGRRDGSRDRDRDRDRHRRRDDSRDRDRDRDRHRRRDGSRDRDRDRRRRSSRSRSNERSSRRRGDSKEKDRTTTGSSSGSSSRNPRDDKTSHRSEQEIAADKYQMEYERERQRLEDEAKRIEDEKKREVDDLTKDQRTIFVGQLTMKVTENNLKEFFSQLGPVKNTIMIRDKNTGKHKGFGYVEMAELDSIPSCLLFNNVVPDFQKFPILVKASEAEKNFVAKKDTIVNVNSLADSLDPRVYVGNLHPSVDENMVRVVAEQFGAIDSLSLQRDDMGNSKCFCFVRYRSVDSAKLAMAGLSGIELVGRPLKVGPVIDGNSKSLMASSSLLPNSFNTSDVSINSQLASGNWKLDDDDGSKGMQMNSQNRHMLMVKLAQGAGMTIPVAPMAPNPIQQQILQQQQAQQAAKSNIPPMTGTPSKTFVIANMFDPATETEENWQLDIRDDVYDECKRFGSVENVYVESKKPGGYVYVKFSTIEAAINAAKSLHGRYFAQKMITVSFLEQQQYDSMCGNVQR